jgi:hypothetical protein
MDSRQGQVRAGQDRAGQVRAGQDRAGQVRAAQVRAARVRAIPRRIAQVSAAPGRGGAGASGDQESSHSGRNGDVQPGPSRTSCCRNDS